MWKGHILRPSRMCCRPTSGLVRGAALDIAGSGSVVGGRIWDLCSGTGSVGLEALSWGADSCVFVDRDRRALSVTRDFLREHSALESATLVSGDIVRLVPLDRPAPTMVFIDPPYAELSLYSWAWSLDWDPILSGGGVVMVESGGGPVPEGWESRKYGDSNLSWKRIGAR